MSRFLRFALFSALKKDYFVGWCPIAFGTDTLILKQAMAQKSITSFFSKAPAKPIAVKLKDLDEIVSPKKEVKVENEDSCSPLKIKSRGSKRFRIDSDSDSNSPPEKRTSTDVLKSSQNGAEHVKNNAKIKELNMDTADDAATEDAPETSQKSPATKANKSVKKNKADEKKSPKNSKKETKERKKPVEKKNSSSTKKKPNKNNSILAKFEERVSSSDSEKEEVLNNDLSSSNVSQEEAGNKMDVSTEENSQKSDESSLDEKCTKQEEEKSPTDKKKLNKKDSPPQQTQKKSFQSFFTTVKKSDTASNDRKDGQNKKEVKSGAEYNPSCSKYHPIDDACWSRGEKVPYLALARTLEEIEKISARLKIVELLSNLFRSVMVLTPCDLLPCVYLCLNRLAPAYESVELGIAETTLMKAIAQSTGRTVAQVKNDCNTMGDLGQVAEQSKSNQRTMFQPAPLTVRGVFDKLKDIAQMSGQASMSKKVDKIQSMFVACRHSESRFLIRSLAGKLRIGLAEQSVLQALAQACTTTPPMATQGEDWPPKVLDVSKGLTAEQFKALIDEQALILKTTYCSCPTYDLIIPVILQHGVAALPNHCRLTPGVPLKPMLAHPTKGVHEVLHRFENVEFTCEWKYDGERAQIHVPSSETDGKTIANIAAASIYSRNQENNTSKYPDVLGRLVKTMKDSVQSCVLDCEAVAWDKEKKQILPFQVLSTRKKKDANSADIKVDVCLFMFDLLYFNGESLVKRPFEERRKLLREHFLEIEGEWHMATSLDCSTTESIQEFLEESVRGNCEGLMVKTLNGKDATYEIAKRSRNWLKLKKDYLDGVGDTIDAVVLGGYFGRGKRAGVYGGFLLACYDRENDEYQSLCKIGTGFSDQDLVDHSKTLKEHLIPAPKGYYRYDSSLEPDHWFDAAQVWEVKCADLSLSPIHRAAVGIVDSEKGISLRFPRFIRIREDKASDAATSAQQIAEMYCNQDQVKNQATNVNKNFEEDFY